MSFTVQSETMPSTYHGCSEEAITKVASVCGQERVDVLAAVYFLFIGAQFLPTSDRMRQEDPEGSWGVTKTEERVRAALKACVAVMKNIDWSTRNILEHSWGPKFKVLGIVHYFTVPTKK